MTSIIALLAIAIFSFPALEAYPTPGPSTDLSAVEKEIIMIRQDVLPGIKVSAKLLKEKLPLSSLHSLVNLHRMINPLLAMIDLAGTLNKTSTTFRVLEVVTKDTCNWLGLRICEKEAIKQIKQTLELQLAFEQEVLRLENEHLKLCKLNRSLPEEYCSNQRTPEEWQQDNMIL